ncbi:MAG TPA: fibrobacter succinogenes major paralogous domain-containing protein [Paludibacter sp.]
MKTIRNLRKLSLMFIGFGVIYLSSCKTVDEPIFGGTVTDIDGNVYHTVTVGPQTWLVENLKTTHFNDSAVIPLVTDSAEWGNMVTPARCWYNNDSANYNETYGQLYNWHTVNTGKLAPKGWHIPTNEEWVILENNVSKYYYKSASLAKILASNTLWEPSVSSGTVGNKLSENNYSGFSAIPGGYRINYKHSFGKIDSVGVWWSSSQTDSIRLAWTLSIKNDQSTVDRAKFLKWRGYSVRCIKD